ncbi:MAG TPA: AarF/UbiB family protein, partial [Dongiaceae bacterium]|nr:AarF/UbiB family protein [Dongiaceae bacterium]
DPHPGNFLITPEEEIAVLDYGAIVTLDAQQQTRYANLLLGLLGMHPEKLGELFRQAGFVCERQEVLEQISDHFVGDDRRNRSVSDRLAEVLDKLRRNRVLIPDSFVAMARVIISVGGFLKSYNVPFNFEPVSQA